MYLQNSNICELTYSKQTQSSLHKTKSTSIKANNTRKLQSPPWNVPEKDLRLHPPDFHWGRDLWGGQPDLLLHLLGKSLWQDTLSSVNVVWSIIKITMFQLTFTTTSSSSSSEDVFAPSSEVFSGEGWGFFLFFWAVDCWAEVAAVEVEGPGSEADEADVCSCLTDRQTNMSLICLALVRFLCNA